jgi:hypothetical protein
MQNNRGKEKTKQNKQPHNNKTEINAPTNAVPLVSLLLSPNRI